MVQLADLQRGQTILIRGAARDVGQAALKIARYIGADVLATVSSIAEQEYLFESFEIPYTRIFSEDSKNLKKSISRLTNGNGVDVVFDLVAAHRYPDSWISIAMLGVYIRIGKTGNHLIDQTGMPSLDNNISFFSLDLATLISRRPQKVDTLLPKAMLMSKTGDLPPNQHVTEKSIAAIGDAIGMIQNSEHVEKVVLEDEVTRDKLLGIQHATSQLNQYELDSNAMYVIAGGLGDLGQRLCRLMAIRGAKYIVIISRRTLSNDGRKALQDDLRLISDGITIYSMACDISNGSMVQEIVGNFQRGGLPLIKGVVQCAAVLKVSLYNVHSWSIEF